MMKKKNVWIAVLVCCLFLSVTVSAAAVIYGSEEKGYMVATHYLQTNKATYDLSGLSSKYQAYAKAGATRWNNTGVITFTQSSSSENKLKEIRVSETTAIAITTTWFGGATGRIIKFAMAYNRAYMDGMSTEKNKQTAAHEFGHTMGLLDLYTTSNRNKLMYGTDAGTATKPTSADITGAKYAVKKH